MKINFRDGIRDFLIAALVADLLLSVIGDGFLKLIFIISSFVLAGLIGLWYILYDWLGPVK